MTALVIGLYSLGSWWQHVQDDWTYGMPRTYQTDAVVGHNHDSSSHPSHFLAVNLKGHIEVFELPAGDPTKVRVFLGPTISGNGADRVQVTYSSLRQAHARLGPSLMLFEQVTAVRSTYCKQALKTVCAMGELAASLHAYLLTQDALALLPVGLRLRLGVLMQYTDKAA